MILDAEKYELIKKLVVLVSFIALVGVIMAGEMYRGNQQEQLAFSYTVNEESAQVNHEDQSTIGELSNHGNFTEDIQALSDLGIINSPDYWNNRLEEEGNSLDKESVKKLIRNVVLWTENAE